MSRRWARSSTVVRVVAIAAVTGLSGCAELSCFSHCGSHRHNSSSLVEFLYPNGRPPPAQNAIPQLRIPLRVGLAFLPATESDAISGLDAAHKEELLERIRQRFSSRRHDLSTLVDLAVVDPVTHSLVLRAGGTDTRHGTTTLIDSQCEMRESATGGYRAASDQMIEHFDAALTQFEGAVRSGKAAVQLVRKNDSGHSGGGGALGWPSILALLMLAT